MLSFLWVPEGVCFSMHVMVRSQETATIRNSRSLYSLRFSGPHIDCSAFHMSTELRQRLDCTSLLQLEFGDRQGQSLTFRILLSQNTNCPILSPTCAAVASALLVCGITKHDALLCGTGPLLQMTCSANCVAAACLDSPPPGMPVNWWRRWAGEWGL